MPELHSTCLQEQFERYIFLENSLKFLLSSSNLERKSFGYLSIFSNGVVNSVFYVSIGTLEWKIISKNLCKFSILLRTLTGKKSLIRQAFFDRVEETAFYVSIDIFWGVFLEKKINSLFFLHNEQKIFGCENSILRVPRNILTEVFLKKMFFLSVLFIEQTFSASCQNNSNRMVETEMNLSTWNLWRKLSFLKKL